MCPLSQISSTTPRLGQGHVSVIPRHKVQCTGTDKESTSLNTQHYRVDDKYTALQYDKHYDFRFGDFPDACTNPTNAKCDPRRLWPR